MIEVYDNFLGHFNRLSLLKNLTHLAYKMGEKDREDTLPVGMVSVIDNGFTQLPALIEEKLNLPQKNIVRCYVNCFSPKENPYFHSDGDCITILYYPNDSVDIDQGGETQFLIEDYIKAIPYVPDRLIKFDGKIPHKATSFRDYYRFTIAIKYQGV
tara:strand:+ start:12536 stop:13003 length:468 start_codon:yes stop_codon:yes gene_type:complete